MHFLQKSKALLTVFHSAKLKKKLIHILIAFDPKDQDTQALILNSQGMFTYIGHLVMFVNVRAQ